MSINDTRSSNPARFNAVSFDGECMGCDAQRTVVAAVMLDGEMLTVCRNCHQGTVLMDALSDASPMATIKGLQVITSVYVAPDWHTAPWLVATFHRDGGRSIEDAYTFEAAVLRAAIPTVAVMRDGYADDVETFTAKAATFVQAAIA